MIKNRMLKNKIQYFMIRFIVVLMVIAFHIKFFAFPSFSQTVTNVEMGKTLPDLSGLIWLKEDSFLAVHDSKNLDSNQPRVSLITLAPIRQRSVMATPEN